MKKFLFLLALITFPIQNLFGQYYSYPYYKSLKVLDANFIQMPLDNYGTQNSGRELGYTYWEHYQKYYGIIYDQGLFFTGKIEGKIYVSEVLWGSLYSPGPILDSKSAVHSHPEDSLKYRVYKISKIDSLSIENKDLDEWPIQWGAPVNDDGSPRLYADEMLWTVYNAYDSSFSNPNYKRSDYPAFPLEVHQNSFAYTKGKTAELDFLDDVVFSEWTIINKGDKQIDSATIGLWTDIDFANVSHNYPQVDTSVQLGYCWNTKSGYGLNSIPAVGYVQLFGPAVPSSGSKATFKGKEKPNYKNLNLSAFWGVFDDSFPDSSSVGPAYSKETAWNIANGFTKSGEKIINPTTGEITKFKYSGDPVTNSGWLSNFAGRTGGGAGFYMFSGSFNLAPKDTQWVMYALIAADGGDSLKSVTELRRRANILKSINYSDLVSFSKITLRDSSEINDTTIYFDKPERFDLFQNYPNPFNNNTTIEYWLPHKSQVKIEIYNSIGKKVLTLLDQEKESGYHKLKFVADNFSSGIYFYRITTNQFSSIKKMILLK